LQASVLVPQPLLVLAQALVQAPLASSLQKAVLAGVGR
jgi:hypothetical protein